LAKIEIIWKRLKIRLSGSRGFQTAADAQSQHGISVEEKSSGQWTGGRIFFEYV
jgi:hypothetical protein